MSRYLVTAMSLAACMTVGASAQDATAHEPRLALPILYNNATPEGELPPCWWLAKPSPSADGDLSVVATPTTEAPAEDLPGRCLELTYRFEEGGAPGDHVEPVRFTEIPDSTLGITVVAYAPNCPHRLAVRLADAKNETFQWNLGGFNADRRFDDLYPWVTLRRDFARETVESHWGENADGVLDYPLRFQSLTLTRETTQPDEGRCFIAAIRIEVPALDGLDSPPALLADLTVAGEAASAVAGAQATEGASWDVREHDPERGLTMTYQWPAETGEKPAWGWVGFAEGAVSPVPEPGCFLLEMTGDGSNSVLYVHLSDANGEPWFGWIARCFVDFNGSGHVWLSTSGKGIYYAGSAADHPDAPTYPMRVTGIAVGEATPNTFGEDLRSARSGTIAIRRITFVPNERHP